MNSIVKSSLLSLLIAVPAYLLIASKTLSGSPLALFNMENFSQLAAYFQLYWVVLEEVSARTEILYALLVSIPIVTLFLKTPQTEQATTIREK